MAYRIAINGFGRIGRNALRAIFEQARTQSLEVVAVNDLGDAGTNAYLLRHDTVHGPFRGAVEVDGDDLLVEGHRVRVLSESDPARLPWRDLGVQAVLECTGRFTSRAAAQAHLDAGADRVVISAPGGDDVDATIVYGVNHQTLTSGHRVISNASCTTNCLAPLAQVLHRTVGVEYGLMTTIHSYTNDQVLTDVYHKDPRRARSATQSMIPTRTGAAASVGLVLPELAGRLDGFAVRVPTINVSLVDLTFRPARPTSADEVDAVLRDAAEGGLRGILEVADEELVSVDFNHTTASATYDPSMTRAGGDGLIKVCAWYDNEWAFATRLLDTTEALLRAA